MMEKEVKIKLDTEKDRTKLFARLRDLNAKAMGRDLERNLILDIRDYFKLRGCLFRLRETSKSSYLTFKGPLEESKFSRVNQRMEVNVPVADPKEILRVLKKSEFVVKTIYTKERFTYELKGVSIQVDKIPKLGWFVEVENPDEHKIIETLKLCCLEKFKRITKSYLELIEELRIRSEAKK